MREILFKYIETSERAFVIGNVIKKEAYYCNEQAKKLYGIHNGEIALEKIFVGDIRILKKELIKAIKTKQTAFFYNIMTTTADGKPQLADLQIGYIEREKSEMFIEITPKTDNRMAMAIHQVDTSNRAEGILQFNDKLTLIHCNNLFHGVFDSNEEVRHSHYGNDFSNGFQTEIRESLLNEIHEKLKVNLNFSTKMKVITSQGDVQWYSLELQRRTLDDSGTEKLMAYMTNIEQQVEIEEQLDDVNRYFSVLQKMWGGKLYRFNIKNRILYRTKEYAQSYNLPDVGEHYPDVDYLKNVIHPEDLQEYIDFIEDVANGNEGSLDSRVKTNHGDYEYHNMTFKALQKQDGYIEEMVGFAENINTIHETKEKLDMVNQYFSALQDLSDDMLYRVDLSTNTLYQTSQYSDIYGIKPVMENYPQSIIESGLIHPEDENNYLIYSNELLKGSASQVEVRIKSSMGDFEYRRLTCYPVYGENGAVKQMFGKIVNIQKVRELEEQANYDSLTKLLNKRAMLEYTSNILENSLITEKHALLFLDLDDFKYVNDNLGHSFGDYLLKTLGERLNLNTRQGDLVGRVGGDEFVVFLRNVPSYEMLQGKAKILLASISEDIVDGDTRHSIQGSIGISVFPDHGKSYEELYHHADIALYESKHHGKNVASLYNGEK